MENERILRLEKRLENAEIAIVALVAILSDTLPPATSEAVNKMCEEFYYINKNIGAFAENTFSSLQ